MTIFAIWRRLDMPGHDAAHLTSSARGWTLEGTAIFRHPAGPARIDYCVETDDTWRTRRGMVRGIVANERLEHVIARDTDGWHLDGVPTAGLAHLCDLDLGFTPATNLLQLRRAAPGVGHTVDLPVVWFDLGMSTLVALPQRYERRTRTAYWYTAPTVPYEGLLELAANGFVKIYPQLWEMES